MSDVVLELFWPTFGEDVMREIGQRSSLSESQIEHQAKLWDKASQRLEG